LQCIHQAMPTRLRLAPPKRPVSFMFDQEELQCEQGDTVAEALFGAGYKTLSRSPKFHRPRGASCLRGGCEGCLVRIDGAPNMIACLTPTTEGMRVLTQNTIGTRDFDLLRVTDWVFPHGINHHEFMAGVPGLQDAMQGIARRITGLGVLPDQALPARPAEHRLCDVVIVGSGASAQALASKLAASGRTVELLDDAPGPGGSMRFMTPQQRAEFASIEADFARSIARIRMSTTAAALFDNKLLVVGPEGAQLIEARTLVFATGAHDTMPAFSGNDIPGVMSARAASLLWSRGIRPGQNAIIVAYPESGPFGTALAGASGIRIVRGTVVEASGLSDVTGATITNEQGKRESITVDAVIVDAPRAPSYELAIQAGATVKHEAQGFTVQTDAGQIAPGIYAIGELVGTALNADAIEAESNRVANAIAAEYSGIG
jgi:sarcosine oxidase, subunit alpha